MRWPSAPWVPGQDGVVVGEDRAGGALAEQLAVDPGGAADQPVGGGALDQLLELAAAALGGDREAAVLDEAAGVDEVGDVLARRAAAGRVAPLDGLGARRVLGQRPARAAARPGRRAPRRSAFGSSRRGRRRPRTGSGGRSAQATWPLPSAVTSLPPGASASSRVASALALSSSAAPTTRYFQRRTAGRPSARSAPRSGRPRRGSAGRHGPRTRARRSRPPPGARLAISSRCSAALRRGVLAAAAARGPPSARPQGASAAARSRLPARPSPASPAIRSPAPSIGRRARRVDEDPVAVAGDDQRGPAKAALSSCSSSVAARRSVRAAP